MKPTFKDIRGITFATTYTWSVEIIEKGAHGTSSINLMTATAVTEDSGNIVEKQVGIGPIQWHFPTGLGPRQLSITFEDSDDLAVYGFFKGWYDSFVARTKSGKCEVMDPKSFSKHIRVTKYSTSGEEIFKDDYLVYPQGVIQYKGSSESELFSLSVTLRIVENFK